MDSDLRSLDEVAASLRRFGVADYFVFIAMLVCCSIVGLYFGWIGHKKKNQSEACDYLMGGRNMQVFPVGEICIDEELSAVKLESEINCES